MFASICTPLLESIWRKSEGEIFFPRKRVFFATKTRKSLCECTLLFVNILRKPNINNTVWYVQSNSCLATTFHNSNKNKEDILCVLHQNLIIAFVSTFAPDEVCEMGSGLLLVPREMQLETQYLLFNSPDNMPWAYLPKMQCCNLVHVAAQLVGIRTFCLCTRWELV